MSQGGITMTKVCSKCKKELCISKFTKNKSRKDGLCTYCKKCSKIKRISWRKENYSKLHEYYLKQSEGKVSFRREDEKIRKAKTHKKCPLCNEIKPISDFHKDRTKPDGIKYRCKVCAVNLAVDYGRKNPEKKREACRKRRAKRKDVKECYTKEDEKYTRKLFKNKCANCGATENLCIDHHYPLCEGHALTRMNAVLLCTHCNCSKNNKDPQEFYDKPTLKFIEEKLKPNHFCS